jgi:hypothetical protein
MSLFALKKLRFVQHDRDFLNHSELFQPTDPIVITGPTIEHFFSHSPTKAALP